MHKKKSKPITTKICLTVLILHCPSAGVNLNRFSEDTDSYDEQNEMMTSTHSVNIVPSGALRYGNNKKKPIVTQQQQQRVPNAHSVYSVLYPPDRPVRYVPRPASTRSLNLNNGDMAGYMKHTAV